MGDELLLRFSIDVLSDGSEYTGDTATLFLSLWKASKTGPSVISEDDVPSSLLARYAVAGCPCDVLSRAAADQRYKLGAVQAVFGCDPVDPMKELVALPGLLYASQQATLTVVVLSDADRLDDLVQTIHGNQTHPRVRICQVPSSPSHHESTFVNNDRPPPPPRQWWMVYEDAHVIVHARRLSNVGKSSSKVDVLDEEKHGLHRKRQRCCLDDDTELSGVVYLYTIRRLLDVAGQRSSILMLPERASLESIEATLRQGLELPVVSSSSGLESTASILVRIIVRAKEYVDASLWTCLRHYGSMDSETIVLETHRRFGNVGLDPGLLVRAQEQTRAWRNHCQTSPLLLQHMPFQSTAKQDQSHRVNGESVSNCAHTPIQSDEVNIRKPLRLTSGSSMIVDVHDSHNGPTLGKVICLDRNQQRQQNLLEQGLLRNRECDDRNMWPERMTEFLTVSHVVQCHDENEIDLDDASESKCQDKGAELLVLGTGCASPSPHRGASGYALIIPCALSRQGSHMNGLSAVCFSDLVVAVDVGEGYCTQWNRYGGGRPLACISLVWISHAHWDHYGGLVNLLLQIELDKRQRAGELPSPNRSNERRTLIESEDQAHILAPLVVAPVKIIKYLTLVLGNSSMLFRSVRIDHPAAMSRALADINERYRKPIVCWENVKVDHSCPTYGCIIGLQREGSAPYLFCYSGDTRPCWQLVQACRRLAVQHQADGGRVDFLLHEATFDATEADMSVAKKHSTVPEAVQVGRDVDARRLLLTHFSQRYHTIPDVALKSSQFDGRMKVGFALDGLTIPLFYLT